LPVEVATCEGVVCPLGQDCGGNCVDGKEFCPTHQSDPACQTQVMQCYIIGKTYCQSAGRCVDTNTEKGFCGGCPPPEGLGKVCGSNEICDGGACISSCPPETPDFCPLDPISKCKNLQGDAHNCKTCGYDCSTEFAAGAICVSGVCQCGENEKVVNGQCVPKGACTGENPEECPAGAECDPSTHTCFCADSSQEVVQGCSSCVQKCPSGATRTSCTSCQCPAGTPYQSSDGKSCVASCGFNEGVVNGRCTPCTNGEVACGSNPPKCQTQDDSHCGLSCQQCASNAACQNGQCTPVCPAGQQLCHPPTFIGDAQACGDTSTGVSTDANGNCQCPEGQDLVVPDLHTAQCVPKCPEGSTRDPNNPNNCICNDPAQTFCTNYNQCINLNSPESCGTPTATSNGISCDDVKTCAAPTGGTATCDSGQCGQTCSPVGDIQYEVCNGACVSTCPSGTIRDPSTCTCQCPPACVDTTKDGNCGGCGVSCATAFPQPGANPSCILNQSTGKYICSICPAGSLYTSCPCPNGSFTHGCVQAGHVACGPGGLAC
jgi:hypothetical protein